MVTATLSSSSTTMMRAAASAMAGPLDGVRLAGDRQRDREGGAAAGAAAHLHLAAVLLDDALAHPEAEAGALALPLGGEERLEDVAQRLLGDAGAVVLHLDQHLTAVGEDHLGVRLARDTRRHANRAAGRHRLLGVEQEIEEDLAQ